MFKHVSKKAMSLALASILVAGVAAGCGNKEEKKDGAASSSPSASTAPSTSPSTAPSKSPEITGTVTASGSTALQPLVQQAATEFMNKNPKVTVQVTGGGSGTGVKNVADGVSSIGNSDVEADAQYKDKLVEHIVAIAPFALIVNKDVKVENLTKQQAADIYSGKITNWKEVGGEDKKIQLIHRQDSSGSRKLVASIIMNGAAFSKEGVTQDSSKTVAEAVGTTSGSIGYVDTPYLTEATKALKIDDVAYSKEAIKDGKYPLYGVERMYTKGQPDAVTKAFLDYILSKEFQEGQVEKLKFLPANLLKK
ncbi:phosphate ABC transporter substrate-binding protein [Paenibacillus contaminans]|uniref:Phosphate-binding protein n=1 Tax=Paenibacillus contaminans TaxID=450362 RepID=A0A329M106_9BACL|nr:phosphate ABC transporter substrate-binding protein [Paenibacillus contaminans]RAV10577.1 phosphate-binding protein [Paenibacillus contaminans]